MTDLFTARVGTALSDSQAVAGGVTGRLRSLAWLFPLRHRLFLGSDLSEEAI